jgi:NDP-sugar pyrophosphorylase family protein
MTQKSAFRPRALVLLAAGQGSRLRPLTERCPKSLLNAGDGTILETILDPLVQTAKREIIVVTGFEHEKMTQFVSTRYADHGVRTVYNPDYLSDTNILSTHVGVSALNSQEAGYFIIETDILAPPSVWTSIIAQEHRLGSFWVTRGVYGPDLTGGIVNIDAQGMVSGIRYEPVHDARFDGWRKMLGVLSVGPGEVSADIRTREASAAKSTAQYYMAPWIEHSSDLPCQTYDLEDRFSVSFNTPEDYKAACAAYLSELRKGL